MRSGELLSIHPYELQFPFELNKHISFTIQVSNNIDSHVAFKVKTTHPKKYCVRPNIGIVLPHSTLDVLVTMEKQKEVPADMQSMDKFLLQGVIIRPESTKKDITSDMFKKESGNQVDEYKLNVRYISPPQHPPATVQEVSDGGSAPNPSVSDSGRLNATTFACLLFRVFPVATMSSGELLSIHPLELQFPFELNKQISCTIQVSNNTDNHVAFKVKTTNPKKYCVRPNTGIVLPHSTLDVLVTMEKQKEVPADMQCRDKFLLQSVITSPEFTSKDITSNMFKKESGNQVDEYKLKVTYVSPPQPPPATVQQVSDGGSAPNPSVSDSWCLKATSFLGRLRLRRRRYCTLASELGDPLLLRNHGFHLLSD